MARFALEKKSGDHVGHAEFSQLGWLPIDARVTYFQLNHVHGIFYGTGPEYLATNFSCLSSVHGHHTRGRLYNFYVPRQSVQLQRTFFVTAIKAWNSLPDSLKSIESRPKFKRELKKFLSR